MEPDLSEDTRWIATVFMLCPVALRSDAVLVAAQMSGNDADATDDFFSIEIEDLEGNLVYYAAHSPIRGVVLSQLHVLETQFPGALWCITRWGRSDDPIRSLTTPANILESLGVRLKEIIEEEET